MSRNCIECWKKAYSESIQLREWAADLYTATKRYHDQRQVVRAISDDVENQSTFIEEVELMYSLHDRMGELVGEITSNLVKLAEQDAHPLHVVTLDVDNAEDM